MAGFTAYLDSMWSPHCWEVYVLSCPCESTTWNQVPSVLSTTIFLLESPLVSCAVCSVSHLFGFCFFLVWRICSVACLLDQLALGTAMNTKSLKQMGNFDFQREKDSIATWEWNEIYIWSHLLCSLLLQSKHTYTYVWSGEEHWNTWCSSVPSNSFLFLNGNIFFY